MSTGTSIEWTDATWNPTRGCRRISPGCENCYAERLAARMSQPGQWGHGFATMTSSGPRWTGVVRLIPEKLAEPLHWKKPRRIFVNSMSDLFHEALNFHDIAAVYGVMAHAQHHTFQVLTKRPERRSAFMKWMCELVGPKGEAPPLANMKTDPIFGALMAADHRGVHLPPIPLDRPRPTWPLPNVWEGTSIENQETANRRLPILQATPAAKNFVSYEPALGPVDFTDGPSDPMSTMGTWSMLDGIDWLIVGGESGPGARPFHIEWARSVIRQCREAGVACFVKQLGAHVHWNGCQGGNLGVWPQKHPGIECEHPDAPWHVRLLDAKGGDPDEWPEDLRVREYPA